MQVNKNNTQSSSSMKPLFSRKLTSDFISNANNNSSATPDSHNIKKPLKNESYHRTIDMPIFGKKCAVIDRNSGNGYIYAGLKSSFLVFITPSCKLEDEYFKIYDGFELRNHISL